MQSSFYSNWPYPVRIKRRYQSNEYQKQYPGTYGPGIFRLRPDVARYTNTIAKKGERNRHRKKQTSEKAPKKDDEESEDKKEEEKSTKEVKFENY